jgi:release factor glutamine methyltransferase
MSLRSPTPGLPQKNAPENATSQGATLRAALRDAIAHLENAHVPSAPLSAELLLMHVIGKDRAWLYAHSDEQISVALDKQYTTLIVQRSSGVPTQHLTGHQEFWGLEFEVTPNVLIPRPETEHLIEVALDRLDSSHEGEGSFRRDGFLRIADVGTGSGCIAVALACELSGANIVATDISAAAMEVARRNAAVHHVASRIDFIECSLLAPFVQSARTTRDFQPLFDLIVSNPPYVGRQEEATLAREVLEHEPELALFAGKVGTELYAPLIDEAAAVIKTGGILVLELGHRSVDHVSELVKSPQWTDVTTTNDLAGIARVISARRAEPATA